MGINREELLQELTYLHRKQGFLEEKFHGIGDTFLSVINHDQPFDFINIKSRFIAAINDIKNPKTTKLLMISFGLQEGYENIKTLEKRLEKYGSKIARGFRTIQGDDSRALEKLADQLLAVDYSQMTTAEALDHIEKNRVVDSSNASAQAKTEDKKTTPPDSGDDVECDGNGEDSRAFSASEASKKSPHKFKIGVSFAGEHRNDKVVPVLNELLNKYHFTEDDIFYDDWCRVLINGFGGAQKLQKIYRNDCDLVVVFLSEEYRDKTWTSSVEWRSILDIANGNDKNTTICLVNADGVDINRIEGLFATSDIAAPFLEYGVEGIAKIIADMYRIQKEQGKTQPSDSKGTFEHDGNIANPGIFSESDNKLPDANTSVRPVDIFKNFISNHKRSIISSFVFILFSILFVVAMMHSEQNTVNNENGSTSTGIESNSDEDISDQPADTSLGLETDVDQHVLLKLANASHQYANGLNYWKRLDYNKAYDEISEARNEILQEKNQNELEVAKINNSLGALCLDMGRYKEANEYLSQAFTTFENENSLEERVTKASIAQYYYYTGNFEDALKEIQEIIDQSDREQDKVIIASISHSRAKILDAQGKYEEALAIYQSVFDLYREFIKDGELSEELAAQTNNPQLDPGTKDYYINALQWILATYNNMGEVYIHMGDYKKAEEVLSAASDISMKNVYISQKNLNTAQIRSNLAVATIKLGKTKDAIEIIDHSIRIQRNIFDFKDDFPGLVKAYYIYGDACFADDDIPSALEKYKKAEELSITFWGEEHPDTAQVCNRLGLYYYNQGDTTVADSYFERAIEIRRSILGHDHPDTAQIYLNWAISQEKAGQLSEAKKSAEAADAMCEKLGIVGSLKTKIDLLLNRLSTGQDDQS